jgi:plastocyanin
MEHLRLFRRHWAALLTICIALTMIIFSTAQTNAHASHDGALQPLQVVAQGTSATVRVWRYQFVPRNLRIVAGTTVTWLNEDDVTHSAISISGPLSFNSGPLTLNQTFSFTFTQAGIYRYRCSYHTGMYGVITVVNSSTATPPPPNIDRVGVYHAGVFNLAVSNIEGTGSITALFGGDPADKPVTGDWNNDGIDTIGVYRNGVFYLSDSNTTPAVSYTFVFGNPGDAPIAGRWDNQTNGDGVGVYRDNNGILYLKRALTTGFDDYFMIFGNPGDRGLAGDWDGNGFDSIGVYRSSENRWYLSNTNGNGITFADVSFVQAAEKPFTADWDGDGISTPADFNLAGYISLYFFNDGNTAARFTFIYGNVAGVPLAGKWTGFSQPPRIHPQILAQPGDTNGGSDGSGD